MKASFPTISAIVGGVKYDVHLRVLQGRAPSHTGADSPDYLRPGSPPRISIIRILRAGVVVWDQVTNDIHWSVRQQIEGAVLRVAAEGGASPGEVGSQIGARIRMAGEGASSPSFSDGENFR